MKLLDFTAVRLALSLLSGIVLGWVFPLDPLWVLVALGVSLAWLLFTFLFENYRYGSFFGMAVLCTSGCLGAFAITQAQPVQRTNHYSRISSEGSAMWGVRVEEVLKPSTYYESYVLEVTAVDGSTCRGRLLGKQKRSENPPFSVDDRIMYYGSPQPINPPANPHQFDFRAYMRSMGVYDQVRLEESNYVRISHGPTGIKGQAYELRERVKEALRTSSLGEAELGVMQALLMGDRDDLSQEVYRQYRDAGAAHILAVSGLHVGILLLLVRILLKPLMAIKNGRPISMGIAILVIWGYALFTGLSPSVIRAATMFSFLSYALFLNRPANTYNILFLSAFVILLIKPEFLFQVGFQLSYAAVFAIAWVYPILLRTWHPRNYLLNRIWKLVAVSLSAQLGVLPLCLHYFHQFPGLFLVTAVLLLPGLGILLGSGVVVVVMASLDSLPEWVGTVYSQMIGTMNAAVALIASQDSFVLRGMAINPTEVFLLYLILISLVYCLKKPRFRNWCLMGSAICLFQISFLFQKFQEGQKREAFILQQVGNSGILWQEGGELQLLSDTPEDLQKVVENMEVHRRLPPHVRKGLPTAFRVEGQAWVVMDSTGVLPPVSGELAGLILTQSPRVHLGRVLEEARPQMVVADGSNYRRQVARWNETCKVYGIPFYSTAERGAFRLYPPLSDPVHHPL